VGSKCILCLCYYFERNEQFLLYLMGHGLTQTIKCPMGEANSVIYKNYKHRTSGLCENCNCTMFEIHHCR
jgi:hypothetical protein